MPPSTRPLRRIATPSGLALVALVGCYTPTTSSRDARIAAFLDREANAPAGPPLRGALTADEAMRRAMERSPTIAAARANHEAMLAAVDAAPDIENPELRIGGMVLEDYIYDLPEVDVRLRVRPPRPVENEARKAEAAAEAREAGADLLAEQAELRALVRTRYVEVLLTRQEVLATTALSSATTELHAALSSQLESGRSTKLDLAVVAFERDRAMFDAAEAADARERAEVELSEMIGVSGNLELAEAAVVPLPELSQCVATALRGHPEVEEKLARLDAAHAVLDQEQSLQLPWITFIDLGYQFGPNTEDPLGFFVGGGIELPIFDPNLAAVDAAEAAVKAREAEVDGELARAATEVRSLHRRADLARKLHERFKTETRPAAERALVEAQAALDASTIDAVTFLEAKVRAAEAHVKEIDLERDAAEAALDLDEVGECVRPAPKP